MYKQIIDSKKLTRNEAKARYPNHYILQRLIEPDREFGYVIYIGDNRDELSDLMFSLDEISGCIVLEGSILFGNRLGGIRSD